MAEFDAIEELGRAVKMPPHKSYQVEISTPGRIAALEAEVEQLRGIGDRLAADCAAWEARVERMDCEAERLREACKPLHLTEWPHSIWYIVDAKDEALAEKFAVAMRGIHIALEPAPTEEECDG